MYERLELYIETLTGTAFELRVSPYETIQDIKARIQKLEGIPITQQHLIWQTTELDDECCLSDYNIQDGATLKLVLTMRGGPINTRRIPMEEPSLRDMAEYLSDTNKDDLLEKVSNRPVTVIVYHNGDQLNFFRVVDREATSPLSESLSGASVYNLYDDEDADEEPEEEGHSEEKHEDNGKTREKMKLLRMKMENMTLNKKHVKKNVVPRPPSSGRPSSKTRLHRGLTLHSAGTKSLNRNKCLPPVGKSKLDSGSSSDEATTPSLGSIQSAKELFNSATVAAVASLSDKPAFNAPLGIRRLDSVDSSTKVKPSLSRVIEDRVLTDTDPSDPGTSASDQSVGCDRRNSNNKPGGLSKETVLRRAQSSLKASAKWDFSPELLLKEPKPPSPRCRDTQVNPAQAQEAVALHQQSAGPVKGLERLLETSDVESSVPGRPSHVKTLRQSSVPTPQEHHTRMTSRQHSVERVQTGGVMLESLHPSEVRAMSGMLSSLVRSASKSRAGFPLAGAGYKDCTRIPTPEGRLVSARLQRLSASRDGHAISPTHRLPPVKQKKKCKRCFVCGKKTGLASSYPCRCSHNYCATHRYPESHGCTFDYKTEGRKLLEQSNPVISAPKLPKI